jgi:hypothetical protein
VRIVMFCVCHVQNTERLSSMAAVPREWFAADGAEPRDRENARERAYMDEQSSLRLSE